MKISKNRYNPLHYSFLAKKSPKQNYYHFVIYLYIVKEFNYAIGSNKNGIIYKQ